MSQADICKATGLGSSTVSQACRGALACTRLSDGLYDASHDALIRYLAKHQKPEEFSVYVDVFAEIAGCSVAEVKTALERGGSLVPAMTLGTFQVRVTHPAAIKFLRAHPFELDAKFFPTNIPAILQTTDAEDRQWTFDHPLSEAFGARVDGADDLRNSESAK